MVEFLLSSPHFVTMASKKPEKLRVSTTMTEDQVEGLDRLVEKGIHLDRGDAVREAVNRYLDLYKIEPFMTREPRRPPEPR